MSIDPKCIKLTADVYVEVVFENIRGQSSLKHTDHLQINRDFICPMCERFPSPPPQNASHVNSNERSSSTRGWVGTVLEGKRVKNRVTRHKTIPPFFSSLFFFTLLLSRFWTSSRGHRRRPFSPPLLAFNFLSRLGLSNPTARRVFIECC